MNKQSNKNFKNLAAFGLTSLALALMVITTGCGEKKLNPITPFATSGNNNFNNNNPYSNNSETYGFYRDFNGNLSADLTRFAGWTGIGYGRSTVPILTTDTDPQYQAGAWKAGFRLKNGDRVSFAGGGAWGTATASQGSALWGIIRWGSFKVKCASVSIDGIKAAGTTGGNLPIGALIASDGYNFYLLGKRANFTVQGIPEGQLGNLYIGLNIPLNYLDDTNVVGICAQIYFNNFRVIRPGK